MTERESLPAQKRHFGTIEVGVRVDGTIQSVGDVELGPDDKLLVAQRHQRAASWSKEDTLTPVRSKEIVENMDVLYDPEVTDSGTSRQVEVLKQMKAVFGEFNAVATTPRKRGRQHLELLKTSFPGAALNEELGEDFADSDVGLLGESFYGAFTYTPEETSRYFRPGLQKKARFGRGPYDGQRTPYSYMETWVTFSELPEHSWWHVSGPEALVAKLEASLDELDPRTLVVTHEANVVALRLLSRRSVEELQQVILDLNLPDSIEETLGKRVATMECYRDLYTELRRTLRGSRSRVTYQQAQIHLLELLKLKSGEGGKGYGAVSVFVVRSAADGLELVEAAYDVQPKR